MKRFVVVRDLQKTRVTVQHFEMNVLVEQRLGLVPSQSSLDPAHKQPNDFYRISNNGLWLLIVCRYCNHNRRLRWFDVKVV